MKCEMYWGYPAIKCKRQAVSKRDVRLMSGKTKTIGMCAECQDKYYGNVTVFPVAEQCVPRTLFPACEGCEYNPCDMENNLDYCPAPERR